MARALPAGPAVRRRPMFGLFDADGWAWATTKAFFWLLVIIVTLGYIPDRAYYFVVSRTIELGILGWSPVNLCPPENGSTMPCPVPVGGILPWQPSPGEASLPQARTDGSAAQLGKNLLYIGGTDGSTPSATTFVAQIDNGNFEGWTEGPALAEARSDAGLGILSGTAYLVGGLGPDGAATDTFWKIGLDPDTSALGTWAEVQNTKKEAILLPEPRAGAAVVPVADGILVIGGWNADGKATNTVWKSTLDKDGNLGAFAPQPALPRAVADANAALEGTYLWVYGGADDNGPVGGVQRANYGELSTAEGSAPPAGAQGTAAATVPPTPVPSGTEGVAGWVTQDALNLPAARAGASGWAANGALYLVGGSDGTTAQRQLYWAIPDASGNLPGGWHHLDATDLPAGVSDAAAVVAGSTIFLLGGTVDGAATGGSYRASTAPQEPFFRLGIAGMVVPALQIGGEIGQQLGYLAAAGVGTGNFVILVAIGWAFNHRAQISEFRDRRRREREARAPKEA